MAEYHGLRKPRESHLALASICYAYARHCECEKPGKPKLWRVAEGLHTLFAARGYPSTTVVEYCRSSPDAREQVAWVGYVASIEEDRPVAVTYCYDPVASRGLAQAKRRVSKCFSMLGIGYLEAGGEKMLICQDGITGPGKYDASVDRVDPATLDIPDAAAPWLSPGTSLYRWDGAYANLVMVFVGRPTR